MITYFPTQDGLIALAAPVAGASSDVGQLMDNKFIESMRRRCQEPRIEGLVSDILQVMEESGHAGAGFTLIDTETAGAAVQFACLLPRSLPAPEVAPDPDGEIAFDWFGPSGKMFSVSINKIGRIAYAGRFGDRSKVHGIEQLSTACPQEIIRGVAKATS